MSRLLMIGIDALDSRTLWSLRDRLPNFRRLMDSGPKIECDGVFPPDSPTSWASIYTGLNPANHGIILFVDPLSRVSTMITKDVDDQTIRGKTFWDIAGKAGKKVCIIPHLLGYPPWNVNGVMIGRSGINQEVKCKPESLAHQIDLRRFRWDLHLFPGSRKNLYLEQAEDQLLREAEAGLEVLDQDEWDIFFISFGELDPIQYSFWRFYDKNDPTYPGPNRYEDVIPHSYEIYDKVVGQFRNLVKPDTRVMIISDHGIGSRPVNLLNVNELLRRRGLLKAKVESERRRNTKRLRDLLVSTVDKLELGNVASKALRAFPAGKGRFMASSGIDWDETVAHLIDQSGIKNYPYGGISIRSNPAKIADSELIKDRIVREFMDIRNSENEAVFNWVRKREELYAGRFQEKYPDVLFELDEKYGAGASVRGQLWGKSLSHNIAPGCHKQHNATMLMSCPDNLTLAKSKINLMDVAPTVLDLIDLDGRESTFDGTSIMYRGASAQR